MALLTRLIAALGVLLASLVVTNGNVIGLDFGSDSMKVAIVKPGNPLEIVTNFQSKRKTQTMITFYKGERMLGSDAMAIMGRKPELTFAKANRMLGRTVDHPLVQEITKKQFFPYKIYANETTGNTCIQVDDIESTYYTPEELIAMMMQHAKDMTAAFGGNVIKDCVITVPSSFTQHERRALYTAADIADLRVLSLIEENTAAALHYGIDRVSEKPNTVLYYNMGASSLQVSIVTYSSYVVKEAGKNKTIGQLEVVGKAWDSSLGGFNFDVKIAELLANRFNEVWNKKTKGQQNDLKEFYRPMTRLRLEANKVKEVLSANQEYPVKAEQLHADVDLVTKVTRAEFEELCDDLFSRLTLPIDAALKMANMTLSDINAVELLGGGIRIPKVKRVLDDYFKVSKLELGQHLNGDEAMALGAAFRAANLSTNFRVRKVGVMDQSSFGVSVRLDTLPTTPSAGGGFFDDGNGPWHKETTIYPRKSPFPAKSKVVAFPYDQDILCKLEYDDSEPLPEGTSKTIAVYNITGIAAFAKENESKGLGAPKVHLSFLLDGNGMVTLTKAEATLELPAEPEEDEEAAAAAAASASAANSTTAADADADASSANNTTASGESSSSSSSDSDSDKSDDEKDGSKKKDKEGSSENSGDASSSTGKDKDKDKEKEKDSKKKDKKQKKEKEASKKKVKKDNTLRRTLTVTENELLVTPHAWTPAQVAESRRRLRALNAADEARKAREAALNDLEGYCYKVKNRLLDEEDELKKVSTDEARQAIIDMANAVEEWLYDEGRNADVAGYKAKMKEISTPAEAIFSRHSELTARPREVNKGLELLANATTRVSSWGPSNTKGYAHITEAERDKVLDLIANAKKWIEDKVAEQEKKSLFEDPVFHSKDVEKQILPVLQAASTLAKKPKPPPPKVEKSNSTASSNDTSSSSSAGTNSSEPIRVNVNATKEDSSSSSTTTDNDEKKSEASGEGKEKDSEGKKKENEAGDEL